MGDLVDCLPGGDGGLGASYQPFDLNENILGPIDHGIRTRRQIASVQAPSCSNPQPTPPVQPKPRQTPSHTPKSLSSDQVACHLKTTFPGREPQVDQLLSVLGKRPGESSPPVLVWGGPATGKTSIIRGALRLLGRPHAYISCRSSGSSRMLFEAVIDQLAGHVRSAANNYTSHRRCTDLNDFVLSLPPVCASAAAGNPKPRPGRPKLATPQSPTKPSRQSTMTRFPNLSTTNFVLVFDHAELLRTEETASAAAALLPVLTRLPELTGVSTLSVVMISSVAWDAFETGTGGPKPTEVHFSDYSAEQLHAILSRGRPPLYPAFLKMVLPPATRINRMLTELNELLEPLFRKYLEPIERGHVERSQAATDAGGRRLYSSLLPHLKAAMADDVSIVRGPRGSSSDGPGFEMSGECRFLLLASYIASRNPASMDSAYLGDEDEGRKGKKRRKSGAVTEQVRRDLEVQEEHLRGPLSFPLERLSAIFHCIAGDYLHSSTSHQLETGRGDPGVVHRQLLTLLGVGLVSRTGGDPIEGGAKYRCNADEELAQKVARSVKFPLASYLLHG